MTLSAIGYYCRTIGEDFGILTSDPANDTIRFDSVCNRMASLALRLFGGAFAVSTIAGVASTVSGLLITKESQLAFFATVGLGVTAHEFIRVGDNIRKNCNITDRSTGTIDTKSVKKLIPDAVRLGKNARFEKQSALPYYLKDTIVLKPLIQYLKKV